MEENELTIGGIKIKFPKKPYPSQISIMGKLVRGLQKRENCLLESPTGSGKTLSLLCSSLAWQKSERDTIRNRILDVAMGLNVPMACQCNSSKKLTKTKRKGAIEYEDDDSKENVDEYTIDGEFECTCGAQTQQSSAFESGQGSSNNESSNETPEHQKPQTIPRIFYCTRTHKQITQVVKELKRSPYATETRMTILSSRTHTCIHPYVSKMPNKDEQCKKLNKEKLNREMADDSDSSCSHDDNRRHQQQQQDGGCSYLLRLKKQPLVYESIGLKHPIWDIEDLTTALKKKKYCPYYAARDLMSTVDIIFCPYNYLIDPRIRSSMKISLENQIVIIDEAHNIEDYCREATTFCFTLFQLENVIKELNESLTVKFGLSDGVIQSCAYFIRLLENLRNWVLKNTSQLSQHSAEVAISRIWSGPEIVADLKLSGLGPENFVLYQRNLSNLNSEETQDEVNEAVLILLQQIEFILEYLYMLDCEFMDDFKVAITKTKLDAWKKEDTNNDDSNYFGNISSTQMKSTQSGDRSTYTVNFWCLNPAVAFHSLKNCHSVILASGTLSPMDTFQSELGTKFEHVLEANHVISEKQVWVGSIGNGPTGINLLATYKHKDTQEYQDEIGRLLLDVCKVIPFGVLCFLPSKSSVSKLYQRFVDTGLIEKLGEHKRLFSEANATTKDFDQLLKDYYDCIDESTAGRSVRGNGALLLAVYRGKASEGLDFSDNYARAVVAVGIPYPNLKDVQIDLKKKYNNLFMGKKKLLNGDEWYDIQAYRAVNQALGRCIRHKNDWGAIILVDDRYFRQPQKYTKGLSKWIRNSFKSHRNYNETLESLKEFSHHMLTTTTTTITVHESIKQDKNDKNMSATTSSNIRRKQVETAATVATVAASPGTLNISNYFQKQTATTKKKQNNIKYDDDSIIELPEATTASDSKLIDLTQERDLVTANTPLMINSSTQIDVSSTPSFRPRGNVNMPFVSPVRLMTKSEKVEPKQKNTQQQYNSGVKRKKETTGTPTGAAASHLNSFHYKKKNTFKKEETVSSPSSVDLVDETICMDDDDDEDFEADFKKPKQTYVDYRCVHCGANICCLSHRLSDVMSVEHMNNLPQSFVADKKDKRVYVVDAASRDLIETGLSLVSVVGETSTNPRLNSFIDDSTGLCWQYYECRACSRLLGLVLRFSGFETKFFQLYANKLLFIFF